MDAGQLPMARALENVALAPVGASSPTSVKATPTSSLGVKPFSAERTPAPPPNRTVNMRVFTSLVGPAIAGS